MTSNIDVELISRFNDPQELNEMEAFLAEAEVLEVNHLLVRRHYDTKACLCIIDAIDGMTTDHTDVVFLSKAAHSHISQFQLF